MGIRGAVRGIRLPRRNSHSLERNSQGLGGNSRAVRGIREPRRNSRSLERNSRGLGGNSRAVRGIREPRRNSQSLERNSRGLGGNSRARESNSRHGGNSRDFARGFELVGIGDSRFVGLRARWLEFDCFVGLRDPLVGIQPRFVGLRDPLVGIHHRFVGLRDPLVGVQPRFVGALAAFRLRWVPPAFVESKKPPPLLGRLLLGLRLAVVSTSCSYSG